MRCTRCNIRGRRIFNSSGVMGNYCKECDREVCREWYYKNKKKRILRVLKYQKETNYKSEKTLFQRQLRNTKRKTRYYFPITITQLCEVCKIRKATERHHYTNPIYFDRFIFICHNCHLIKNRGINLLFERRG